MSWPWSRRADDRALLRVEIGVHRAFIEHLQAEVEFWRKQFAHERQRAEVSVDQRLAERGLGPVTLPPRPIEPEPPDPRIEALFSGEGASIGQEVP